MTGLDTNVLVRYLTHDDPQQFRAALRLLNKKGAIFFVPDLVLVEVDWVLSGVYGWTRDEIAETFARLLMVHNLVFEDEGRIRGALKAVRLGADLSDALIAALARDHGCRDLATFDMDLLKQYPKFAFTPK
jgi:predicted nucleic-acid-binding protein